MAKQPQESPATEGAEAPRKKGKKLILIAGVLVLALGGGGAGAWYFMRPAATHDDEKAAEAEKPAQFLALESFTVNLAGQDGAPQYLQAGLTLKLKHDMKVEAIKDRMPEIRNRILLILSGKKASELLPVAGKQQLAAELSSTVREIVGDAAGGKPAPKKAKAKAKAEADAEEKDGEASEKDDETEAKEAKEAKAEAKAKAKKSKTAATELAKNDIEVLFTSFIIQ
jgi:flagellar protein FliL